MPRKLKVYTTSQGFFDLALAAPSMKAALEAWGGNMNLFHQGFANETDDPDIVTAAMAQPGVVLKRPVGSSKPFREDAELPSAASLDLPRKPDARLKKEKPGKAREAATPTRTPNARKRGSRKKKRRRRQARSGLPR